MLRRTLAAFPRYDKDYTEVKYLGRRLLPMPLFPTLLNVRDSEISARFKDIGPDYDRVWVSLGANMRSKRVGRSTDRKDLRYYWRPLNHSYQRKYTAPARRQRAKLPSDIVPRLHPKANEQGLARNMREFEHKGIREMYGAKHAAPLPMDWEYRVF
jgi:hypothetical protein